MTIPGFNEEQERAWIEQCVLAEEEIPGELHVIFCQDDYLLRINEQYLDHRDYTDVITFDYTEEEGPISGDIFISYDRVVDNALTLGEPVDRELRRVLIHGVLHLLGYADGTSGQQAEMRRKENYCLSLRE